MRTWCLVGAGKEGTPILPLWLAAQASLGGQRREQFLLVGINSWQAGLWAVWDSQERRSPGLPGEGPQTLARVGGKESIYPGGLRARPSWGGEGAGRHGSSHKSGVHILDVRPGMHILPNLCRGWGRGGSVNLPPECLGSGRCLIISPSSSSVTKVRPAWVPPPGVG